MPYKDKDKKLASQREHYRRHREEVIAKVKARKHKEYAGVCKHCGGPTVGSSKNNIPDFCSKPECRSAEYQGFLFLPSERRKVEKPQKKRIMTIDEVLDYHKRRRWDYRR